MTERDSIRWFSFILIEVQGQTVQNPNHVAIPFLALVLLAVVRSGESAVPDNFRYGPVPRSVIEDRLKQYVVDNKQREASLKRMFAEAGCDDQHLSEQRVKEMLAG